MTLLQALVVGVVQGVTEFLPISSDGHLALVYRAFGMSGADPTLFAYTVFLHGATLVAMVVYFRRDLLALLSSLLPAGKGSADRRLLLLIAGATVVSGGIAVGMGGVVEAANESLLWIGLGFLGTAALLSGAEVLTRRRAPAPAALDPSALTWPRLAGIAVAQALAVLPGVSRSGSTIAGGMSAGLDRGQAARFSFLLGIPLIALASAKDVLDVAQGAARLPGAAASAVGFVAALASGYAAIWGLLALVKRHSLWWFAGYTALVGAASIALHFAA